MESSSGRRLHPQEKITPAARKQRDEQFKHIIDQVVKLLNHNLTLLKVESAVNTHPVVVVGMSQNPYVKKARKALEDAKIEFKYLEYGSYFSQWKERLAIKMWSGWPTFPQVYVNGTLIGGFDDTVAALKDGTFETLLNAKDSKSEDSKSQVTLEE